MNHFRHCPKHRLPLPCRHCALAPGPSPVVVAPERPVETQPKKRGRRPKYKSNEERRAADAARKHDERSTKKANEIIAAHPDNLGSQGESSAGFSPQKIEQVVGAQQRAEAIGLGTDRDPDAPELSTPDRRRV